MKVLNKLLLILIFSITAQLIHAANFYWVGGSGNWNDINHWRTTSGGSAYPITLPTKDDDVFFDVNSGFTATSKTVSLNVTGECRNITFTGSAVPPNFYGGTINIYGSSEWQTGMTVSINNIYYKNTGTTKTIKSNGVTTGSLQTSDTGTNYYVYIEEESTTNILDDFKAGGYLSVRAGAFNTNNNQITVQKTFFANYGNATVLNLGSSIINIGGAFNSNHANTTINAGTSQLHFSQTGSTYSSAIYAQPGQTFYDVYFKTMYSSAGNTINGGTSTLPLNFHDVNYLMSGSIYGYNNFSTLSVAVPAGNSIGSFLQIFSGTTQKISTKFSAKRNCGNPLKINSTTAGSVATIDAPSTAVIDVEGVVLQDIKGTGGAVFNAVNSADNGNNPGWTFTNAPQNYYWIGGSGDWSDKNHWSTTSGGATASCLPGPMDNAFFDANSGFTSASKTVTLNSNDVYIHDITFSGSPVPPVLQSGIKSLNIYGSSEWQSGMQVFQSGTFANIYYQNTGEAKTIKSNGVIPFTRTGANVGIIINETNSITLLDDFKAYDYLYINSGSFNTNGFKVTANYIYANSGKTTTLNLGSSHLYVGYFYTNNAATILNSGTSTVHAVSLISAHPGQTFYDAIFGETNTLGTIASTSTATTPVNFHDVTFLYNSSINRFNNFSTLTLAGGVHTIQSSTTQKILTKFVANRQCNAMISLKSSIAGTVAVISAAAGVVIDVDGVIMQDVQGTGGATFTASNSLDNGNNPGWTFTAAAGKNLYWVGGTGNWNDKAHWSDTSGGTGGYCVPGTGDNVFFDVNSGFTATSKTVTVDGNGYAHNVTFDGSVVPPTVNTSGTTPSLNIYGSTVWQSGMTLNVGAIYYRNSGEAKTIKSNGVYTGNSNAVTVTIEETNSISLLDDFYLQGSLSVNAGTFNTNNYNVTTRAGGFSTYTSMPKTLNLGSSHIYTQSFGTSANNTTLNAGTSTIHLMMPPSYGGFNTLISGYPGHTFYDVIFEGTNTNINSIYGGTAAAPLNFHSVTYQHNGAINGFNNFGTLTFAPGKTYTFAGTTTQNITTKFSANRQCGGFITINTTGGQVTLNAGSAVVIDVDGVKLSNNKATGGAAFIAYNSFDISGNSGWTFATGNGKALYWVGGMGNWNDIAHWSATSGGTGGYCVPGPGDDVFFDAGSGFTSTSKTVTLDATSYAHNVTFSGSAIPPTLTETGTNALDAYGSIEWQSGMTMSVDVYLRNSNEDKTIKTNGVVSQGNYNIQETKSVSLLDDFTGYRFEIRNGTFNTNNNTVDVGYFTANSTLAKTLNLGSSTIIIENNFETNNSSTVLNAGTSTIKFNSYGDQNLNAYPGQVYNDVIFEMSRTSTIKGGTAASPVVFHDVIFKVGGTINGTNNFSTLKFAQGLTYSLQAGQTQNIVNWLLSGIPCASTVIQSTVAGTRANVNVTGSNTSYNFAKVKDINAIGNTLYFGAQSIDNGNNNNLVFAPYDSGSFTVLGPDRSNAIISSPSTYTLNTSAFNGDAVTVYKWYKVSSTTPNTVISTTANIDIRNFGGYGTYKVTVSYTGTTGISCEISDTIIISPPAMVNPHLRMRVSQ